jgi:hypothetical protein
MGSNFVLWHRGKPLVILFGLTLVLVGFCSRAIAEDPKWLLDARAKEGQLTESHVVTSADKRINFSVPVALVGQLIESKDYYQAFLKLAPEAIATCQILNSPIDVAAMLRQMANTTFSAFVRNAHVKLEERTVERIDAGVGGATPYLAASWSYRVNDGHNVKVGVLRQYAAARPGHGIYCALNNPGYTKTFEAVVHALIASLKIGDEDNAPYFSEVTVATQNGTRIGFLALEMRRDKHGNTEAVETIARLNAGFDAIQSRDAAYVERTKTDGSMIRAKRLMSLNGEIDMDLELSQSETGRWQVKGKFKGKDVNETIASGAPGTQLSQIILLRSLLAKDDPIGAQASSSEWQSVDPGHFTDVTVKILAAIDTNTYSVRQTSGNSSVDLVVDRATGLSTRAVGQSGPVEITFERVYTQGSP